MPVVIDITGISVQSSGERNRSWLLNYDLPGAPVVEKK